MDRVCAWASYSCCRGSDDEHDEEECSKCGLTKEEMAKLESKLKHLTTERGSFKKEIDELKLENDEFEQVIHELELENTQIQSKYDLSEEKRKNERMKLFYSFMMHAMAIYKKQKQSKQNDSDEFDEHKYSIAAPIPDLPLPQQMDLFLEHQTNRQNRILALEQEVLQLTKQTSLLDSQVDTYRKRESVRKRDSFALVGYAALARNAHNADFANAILPVAPPLGGIDVLFMPKKPEVKPSIPMKTLHWRHLPDRQIKETIWEEISKLEEDIVSKDIFDEKKDDDIPFMDRLFAHLGANENISDELIDELRDFLIENEYDSDALQEDIVDYFRGSNIYETNDTFVRFIKTFKRKDDQNIGLNDLEQFFPQKERKRRGGRKKRQRKQKIQLINSKRAYNVSIILGGLKMKISTLKYGILTMDEKYISIDILLTLINIVPTPEEITKVMTYNGKPKNLGECERFFLQFTNMENIKDRLEVWAFKRQFEEKYAHRMNNVLAMSFMQETIRTSNNFKIVLASLLAIGNYINGGTKKGGKHGFVLKTLQKIGTYRTTDNKMSILGYVYKYLRYNSPEALEWVNEFEEAGLADVVRIESDQLDSDITKMGDELQKLRTLLIGMDDSKDENDKFGHSMYEFYNDTRTKVEHLQQGWSDCVNDILDLAAFFGEMVKVTKFKPEEFFAIFNDFRKEFIENREKILELEEKKARKERITERKFKRKRERQRIKQEREQITNIRRYRRKELERRYLELDEQKNDIDYGKGKKQQYLQVEPNILSDYSTGISGIDTERESGYTSNYGDTSAVESTDYDEDD